MAADASPAALVAARIVESQERVVGAAAWKLAKRVRHLNVSKDRRVEISSGADAGSVIDAAVEGDVDGVAERAHWGRVVSGGVGGKVVGPFAAGGGGREAGSSAALRSGRNDKVWG